jgi:hypothetical protein
MFLSLSTDECFAQLAAFLRGLARARPAVVVIQWILGQNAVEVLELLADFAENNAIEPRLG